MQNDSTDVEYRDIAGFPGYRIGSDGSFWTCKKRGPTGDVDLTKWRLKRVGRANSGYQQADLRLNDKRYVRYIHRLVYETFVGPIPKGYHCCHNDGNKDNNNLSNLRVATPLENIGDKRKHGTQICGEKNYNSVLTDAMVIEARDRHSEGASKRWLAKHFGVSEATIRRAIQGETWKHINHSATPPASTA